MKHALALCALLASASACERVREPLPLPAPQCPYDGVECDNDRDCPTRGLGRSFCVRDEGEGAGCCFIGDGGCFNDLDCRDGAVCDSRRGLCEELSSCFDTTSSSDCPDDEHCISERATFRCTDVLGAATSCTLRAGVARSGQPVQLDALALDSNGAPVAHGALVWSAASGTFDDDELTAVCAGPVACDIIVSATTIAGGALCEAIVRVYPPVPDGETRVIVVDADGAPVQTRVDARIDGAFVTAATSDGSVTFDGIATVVSAFPDGHEWQTFVDPPRDVILVVAPLRDTTVVSGAKGTVNFDSVHTQGDIKVAFTSLALPSLVDVARKDIFGVPVSTRIELEGVTLDQVVDYPSTFTIELGDNPIKGDWLAFGDSPLLWSIGAQVPLGEIGPLLVNDASFAAFARALVPLLRRADHGVSTAVSIGAGTRPDDDAPFAEWPLDEALVTPNFVLVGPQELVVDDGIEPDLVTIALARIPTIGFVPIGIGGATSIDFAPTHDGLEGNEMIVAALDVDLATLDRVRASFASLPPASRDENAPPIPPVALPPFLPYVDGAFDGVAFTSTNDPNADIYRVRFDGWTIWSATPPTFSIDELHAGDVDVAARAIAPRVDAIAGDVLAPSAISSRPARL